MDYILGMYMSFVVPWLLISVLHIPQYIHYLQLADYDFNKYTIMVFGNKAGKRYRSIYIFLIGILLFISICTSFSPSAILYRQPTLAVVLNLGVILAAIYFTPRYLVSKTIFPISSQAIRLIIISFLVELVPVIFATGLILGIFKITFDPNNSPESMILAFAFVSLMDAIILIIGPLTYIFTPYGVMISERINWLVERTFRKSRAI